MKYIISLVLRNSFPGAVSLDLLSVRAPS